jgi:hypothetical protein
MLRILTVCTTRKTRTIGRRPLPQKVETLFYNRNIGLGKLSVANIIVNRTSRKIGTCLNSVRRYLTTFCTKLGITEQ